MIITIAGKPCCGKSTTAELFSKKYNFDRINTGAIFKSKAKEMGKKLIKKDAKVYTITDRELEKVYKSYPILWKNINAKPTLCFIGCPHLSMSQLKTWAINIINGLNKNGRKKVTVRTILTTSPQIADKFRETDLYKRLVQTGVKVSSICPLMYTNNPIAGKKPIITSSNKLRTYSASRFYKNDDILTIITGGKLWKNLAVE